ncbi:CynR [Pseudomonas fluorescens HK44]|uniref:CynR n=1 Tax=Pseudomonas fluorescens HK44 TaxID=1042209 RepID=A0A010T8K0_PSEFL|nr:LysR substrate-binding domain-containing protein [Pseudomonas fluorescens]EXF93717.1 CynR [Pseudomonas fluorescens HK44]
MFSCSESEQKQLNTWVSFQSAEQPLLGQFSVSGNTDDHPLKDFTSIPIKELAHHRLIALTNTYGIQRYINKMFESENVAFTPAYRCNQQSVAIALCQAGLGVGFMTAQSLGQQGGNSKLLAIPLDHPIARESQCHILRSSDRRLHPASEHLWWLLVNHLERTQNEGAI